MTSARLFRSSWKRRDLITQIPVAICCVLGARAVLTQDASAQLLEKKVLTLAAAREMVAAAEAEAERNHLAGVVAVVDDGGWAILLERMDNAAYIASVELALGKARRPRCSGSRARRWKRQSTMAGLRR
jgi:Haem degrading protein HbpS-like